MKKIQTIFDRNWNGDKKVVDKYAIDAEKLKTATATEKLDGMNVRLTVRNHILVRLEKRRNPDKIQKEKGIVDPWYVDADEYGPEDKYLWQAARNTDLSEIEDGEWSGEALGEKIQGNPLQIEGHTIVLFSLGKAPEFENVPITYEGLKSWLPLQESKFGKGKIEGIVWHCPNGEMFKIKFKDFGF